MAKSSHKYCEKCEELQRSENLISEISGAPLNPYTRLPQFMELSLDKYKRWEILNLRNPKTIKPFPHVNPQGLPINHCSRIYVNHRFEVVCWCCPGGAGKIPQPDEKPKCPIPRWKIFNDRIADHVWVDQDTLEGMLLIGPLSKVYTPDEETLEKVLELQKPLREKHEITHETVLWAVIFEDDEHLAGIESGHAARRLKEKLDKQNIPWVKLSLTSSGLKSRCKSCDPSRDEWNDNPRKKFKKSKPKTKGTMKKRSELFNHNDFSFRTHKNSKLNVYFSYVV